MLKLVWLDSLSACGLNLRAGVASMGQRIAIHNTTIGSAVGTELVKLVAAVGALREIAAAPEATFLAADRQGANRPKRTVIFTAPMLS